MSPVTGSDFEAAIPANNANVCDRILKWFNVPALLAEFFNWMLTSTGDLSAEFKSAMAQTLLPSGTLTFSASINMGDQWLQCNGQAVSRTTYADLYNAIGTTYGSGDGSTTFNVPDGSRRSLIGVGGSWSVPTINVGAETHTQTVAEMPAHSHGLTAPSRRNDEKGGGANIAWTGTSTEDTEETGGGQPFSIVHPCIVAYMFIHV